MRMSVPAQFARFLVVGLANTAFGYGVFAGLVLAGVAPMAALVLAYLLGVPFNFVTTGRWVFGGLPRSAGSFVRFVAAYAVIFVFNTALYRVAQALVALPLLAQALCLPVVAVFSFLVFRLHVFKEPAPTGKAPR